MNKRRICFTKIPMIVWIVRIAFSTYGIFIAKYFAISIAVGEDFGRAFLGGIVLLNVIGIFVSCARFKIVPIILAGCVFLLSLTIFVPIDFLLIKGKWLEQAFTWIVVMFAQMPIPIAISFYLLREPKVKEFYHL